jgi:large subunit ribosomal protein L4
MKIDLMDLKGNSQKKIELNDSVFGAVPNSNSVVQYLRVFSTNQRQGTSKTKTRAEVSGGGRKPWKQKHTGRSRQGSIRSPIWVHGGTAHGPLPKDWTLKVTKDIKNQAMKVALSEKVLNNSLFVMEKVELDKPNTKQLVKIISNLKVEGKILIVWSERSWNLLKSASNIPGVLIASVNNLNTHEVLYADYLILEKGAVKLLEERLK